mmetsp:Transcript_26581/g.79800  ORF Transcript_26581/g.79800 Transcript_26581/m.79800 type:complete len:222 (+) Transcript_26581:167-832(+)
MSRNVFHKFFRSSTSASAYFLSGSSGSLNWRIRRTCASDSRVDFGYSSHKFPTILTKSSWRHDGVEYMASSVVSCTVYSMWPRWKSASIIELDGTYVAPTTVAKNVVDSIEVERPRNVSEMPEFKASLFDTVSAPDGLIEMRTCDKCCSSSCCRNLSARAPGSTASAMDCGLTSECRNRQMPMEITGWATVQCRKSANVKTSEPAASSSCAASVSHRFSRA